MGITIAHMDSEAQASGKIQETDGSGGFNYITTPAGGGGGGNTDPNRNYVHNSDFDVWQVNSTFSPGAFTAFRTADRWVYFITGTVGRADIKRSTDVPTFAQSGHTSKYSVEVDVTTLDSSIGASEFMILQQMIEGADVKELYGEEITVSFWHKHTKTGTHCISLRNGAFDFSYPVEYNQAVTNTWEKASITLTHNLAGGTWETGSSIGFSLVFTIAMGSDFHGTNATWQAGADMATSNQVNNLDSTSNFMKFSQIKIEKGDTATEFITTGGTFKQELAICERYYEKSYAQGVNVPTNSSDGYNHTTVPSNTVANNTGYNSVDYKVRKRATPTLTIYSWTSSTSAAVSSSSGTDLAAGSGTAVNGSDRGFYLKNGSGGNITAVNFGLIYHWSASDGGFF